MRRPFIIALLLLAGCSQILGLEDRELVPANINMDAGNPLLDAASNPPDAAAASCETYCSEISELCPAGPVGVGVQVFELPSQCAAVCPLYPAGDPAAPTDNTLACRLKLLNDARRFGEAAAICQSAGPGGAAFKGRAASCGTSCESFCNLRAKVCPTETLGDCAAKCPAIPDPQDTSYNAKVDFGSGKDTFNCRMAHLAVAATYQAANDDKNRHDHCEHSGFKSTGPCDLAAGDTPSCADYCKIVMTGCADKTRVYESEAQCEAVCAKFPNAKNDSANDDTLRCRRFQAYEALNNGATARSCEAAGPVPLECGGSKCASFCQMLLSTCSGGPFNDMAGCMTACDANPDSKANRPIGIGNARMDGVSNNTLSCRVLGLMQAIAGDTRGCAEAFGTGTICK